MGQVAVVVFFIIWRQTPYTTVTKFLNLTWQCGRFNGTKFKV